MNVLIIDDEFQACNSLKELLLLDGIENVTICTNALKGEKLIEEKKFDVVLLDINMPEKTGNVLLKEAIDNGSESMFIILSAINEIPMVVECIKAGAYDYLIKPLQIDLVTSAIRKAYEYHQVKNSLELFTSIPLEIPESFNNFFTNDINMKKLINYGAHLASLECNILISGETGTGKELFSTSIHNMSSRKNNNFVAVNINAVPHNLFESTLFGYVKGAFTGADKDTEGLLHKAHNGTLFLDEIGDLDMFGQAKLLRVLQEQMFYRVGSNQLEKSNFRLIAATNKDLKTEINQERFRKDLYYRLKESFIHLPPLKSRGNDIIYIAKHLLSQLSKNNKNKKVFTNDALFKLSSYSFPGNFRELQQVVNFAYYKCITPTITIDDISFDDISDAGAIESLEKMITLEELKQNYVSRIIKICKTKEEAASILGITRRQLYNLIQKYDLQC